MHSVSLDNLSFCADLVSVKNESWQDLLCGWKDEKMSRCFLSLCFSRSLSPFLPIERSRRCAPGARGVRHGWWKREQRGPLYHVRGSEGEWRGIKTHTHTYRRAHTQALTNARVWQQGRYVSSLSARRSEGDKRWINLCAALAYPWRNTSSDQPHCIPRGFAQTWTSMAMGSLVINACWERSTASSVMLALLLWGRFLSEAIQSLEGYMN